jgi:hypothetical protein
MKQKAVFCTAAVWSIVLVAFFAGPLAAAEAGAEASKADETFVSCSNWMNCNTLAPNYTGFCCRTCKDASGQVHWRCDKFAAQGERPDASTSGHTASGEATFTGIVTMEGILNDNDHKVYAVAGNRAERIQRSIGKEIEVKGTVQEAQGKVAIDVVSYKLMPVEPAKGGAADKAGQAFTSCTDWQNCNSLAPNYTGTCCRQCKDAQGTGLWDCKVFSAEDHFDMAEWVH